MLLYSITWDVDPWLIKFGNNFGIRWYGLLFACAFLFGYLIFQKFFKKEGFSTELLDQLTLYVALGTVLGARLGHCLFYDASYYLKNPLEIFAIWRGGLASHGAAIGILIALFLYIKKYKISFLWLIDRISVVTALGGAFIRIGNLMNSEIYGKPTTLPWGFRFVKDHSRINFYDPVTGALLGKHLPCHPTQLYEAISYLIIFVILFYIIRKYGNKIKNGLIFSIFLITLFTARFFIEYLKYEQSEFEIEMINNLNMNMGQLLSLPFIALGIILLIPRLRSLTLIISFLILVSCNSIPPTVECEGQYPQHLQGITSNKKNTIYWSFTSTLVKTDLKGKILAKSEIPTNPDDLKAYYDPGVSALEVLGRNHLGDLCLAGNKLYVAWSDKFNQPGAKSRVYIYDASDLKLLAIKPVTEATFGAGGIEYFNGHFFVVGGLPPDYNENYVFEYDKDFNYICTHVINSGYTRLGIQTVCFHDNFWWFGCYTVDGKKGLLKTDKEFKLIDTYDVSPSIGLIGWGKNKFLVAEHFGEKYQAIAVPMQTNDKLGLVLME